MDARPKLLAVVRDRMRARHSSYRTEQAYVGWIKRFALYSGKRHPSEMGAAEVEGFLTHLAVERQRGYDIRTVQELMGHADVRTTQIYTHVMKKGAGAAKSPLY